MERKGEIKKIKLKVKKIKRENNFTYYICINKIFSAVNFLAICLLISSHDCFREEFCHRGANKNTNITSVQRPGKTTPPRSSCLLLCPSTHVTQDQTPSKISNIDVKFRIFIMNGMLFQYEWNEIHYEWNDYSL